MRGDAGHHRKKLNVRNSGIEPSVAIDKARNTPGASSTCIAILRRIFASERIDTEFEIPIQNLVRVETGGFVGEGVQRSTFIDLSTKALDSVLKS